MFWQKKSTIDIEIERVIGQLAKMEASSVEYGRAVKNLEVLYQSRSQKGKFDVDMNVVVGAVTNLVGIVLILKQEYVHAVTSKAISFVFKGRV